MVQKREITLTEMKNGQTGIVVTIEGGTGMKVKLEGLGIRNGVKIYKKSSLMGHGPVVVSVGTGEIAIGYGMANKVFVEAEE